MTVGGVGYARLALVVNLCNGSTHIGLGDKLIAICTVDRHFINSNKKILK